MESITKIIGISACVVCFTITEVSAFDIDAKTFDAAESMNVTSEYVAYDGAITNKDVIDRPNKAVWKFNANKGPYLLAIEYAAAQSRPVDITLNGQSIATGALASITKQGCWVDACEVFKDIGTVNLNDGENILTIYRDHPIPSIRTIRFTSK